MKVAIYCRVSRNDLNLDNQLNPLKKRCEAESWEYEIFTEKESSRNTRPIKEELLKKLRNREFDAVIVYALDRWCRSVSEFALELDEFNNRKIGFYSLREGFNFDSAIGRAMATMAMTFAQLERDLIRERTMAGLDRATSLGKIKGRHPLDCGCGKNGHNGFLKPIRENNKFIGWTDERNGKIINLKEFYKESSNIKRNIRTSSKKFSLKENCERCGSKERLERHHINYTESPKKFLTLCFNCHKLIEKQTPPVQPINFREDNINNE